MQGNFLKFEHYNFVKIPDMKEKFQRCLRIAMRQRFAAWGFKTDF